MSYRAKLVAMAKGVEDGVSTMPKLSAYHGGREAAEMAVTARLALSCSGVTPVNTDGT